MRSTVASANGRPAICRLSGRPSVEKPLQRLSAGAPVRLNGAITRRPLGEKKGGFAISSMSAGETAADALIWPCRRSWVGGIVPGDGVEHQRAIGDGPGHRPAMVERVGERNDAAAADHAVSRLESGDAAIAGGAADRARGVG